MQTLRTGCSKAEPKIFAPPQTPFPGHRTTKIYSVGDGHYLHLQTQFGDDRCMQFRVIVVTDTAHPPVVNTPTDRTDNNTLHGLIICGDCDRVVTLWRESLASKNSKTAQSLANPADYENLFPGLQDSLKTEQFLTSQRRRVLPANSFPTIVVRCVFHVPFSADIRMSQIYAENRKIG